MKWLTIIFAVAAMCFVFAAIWSPETEAGKCFYTAMALFIVAIVSNLIDLEAI